MSDVSMAVEQDEVANSLVGEPEQQPVEGVEQPETEQEPQQTDVDGEQIETDEGADDWLPAEQRTFSEEDLLRYATRYQKDAQWLSDPLNRQLITDKINTDIFVRQQQLQQEQWEQQQAEQPEEQQPEPTQQQVTREQYFQNLDRMVAERTDPQVAKEFHAGFLRAFGVPEADINNMPPQQAQAFTGLMSKYALNLFNTFFPDMLSQQLQPQLNQVFPEFGSMYERAAYASSWDQVRNSNPAYANLPAFGTKDFAQTLRAAQAKFPEVMAAFEDEKGNVPASKAKAAYGVLAKIASGQGVDPALLQRAAAAGARNGNRAAARRSAGNLGSGQSKAGSGAQGASRFQSNQDLFDDDTMEIYHREHGRL